MTDPIPANIRALLAAVRDALDLPLAATEDDHKTRAKVIDRRVSDTHLLVNALLKQAFPFVEDTTEQLLAWTAEHPIAYTPFVFRAATGE
ncbi:hypothetical protein QMK19_30515 [Streptomyces sp. H10-C2]|uniref:hypothetical protein n=1 Tax=unclassified Streptomyces TaxID=2593676 RepID=UPI0024BAB4E3|nr:MULTISPECIES: hypothetical protein [unclassified Streptomyces]MDJ0345966.1 hypothetical protein [Streptomyces sp. PH10-H1]MDJ0373867.1 hypothetical protein [Streptomyces sp. H10-C2]